jgi:hypothetical protein
MKAGLEPGRTARERPRHRGHPLRVGAPLHGHAARNRPPRAAPWRWLKGAPERVLGMCHQAGRRRPRRTAGRSALAAGDRGAGAPRPPRAGAGAPGAAGGHRALEHADGVRRPDAAGPGRHHRPAARRGHRGRGQCREAGIRVKMITGDHGVTASAIATQLGMGEHLQRSHRPRHRGHGRRDALRQVVADADVFRPRQPRAQAAPGARAAAAARSWP